jgi:Zn-finger nucleic acid-binding protein
MASEAGALKCPNCGAPADPEHASCAHCGTTLALVACPSCFAMIFRGSKYCPHCGGKAERTAAPARSAGSCPRCHVALDPVRIGEAVLHECPRCAGFWIESAAFGRLCAEREQQAAVLGAAAPVTGEARGRRHGAPYVPCPKCHALMNQYRFGDSRVILDVCRGHGVWFDPDELRAVVEFIREGGDLERSLEEQRAELEDEHKRLVRRAFELEAQKPGWEPSFKSPIKTLDVGMLVASTRHLLRVVMGRDT